ncbi:arsenate reductase ArsC [Alcanivorax sp. S6407]|uniref:arsenate reductase ArsC n=1 Tax=Alcanivorax sp. S6407 TaxID=2926424 RepID=UPI001FF21D9A|nr:arsenate reductase ArsC [Alcanivorax sp. S6407]MCK0154853.1 arsenate reductase ArsC [Alcanivorax sp. S6407]
MQLQPLTILVLCTGNSCRSIIGEALINHLGVGRFRGLSAGSHPTGQVNPGALAVLARHGIVPENPGSKSMDDLEGEEIDLIITVCDSAAGEACPVWLGDTPKLHWGLPDPAHATGTDDEIAAAFEATYQQLEGRLRALFATSLDELNQKGLVKCGEEIHQRMGDL